MLGSRAQVNAVPLRSDRVPGGATATRVPRVTLFQPRTERPPEGLARGRWEAPAWAIVRAGRRVVVLGAVAYLVLRARATPPRAEPRPARAAGGAR